MHRALVTAIIALTSGSAMASSIEYVDGAQVSNGSFTPMKCASCPPLKERTRPDTYAIPSIAPGTQQTEVREINGHKEMIRTEAWLGGAPVTFVTKKSRLAAAGGCWHCNSRPWECSARHQHARDRRHRTCWH